MIDYPVLSFSYLGSEESLLTLRALGIQTTSISPYYFLPATTRFIPTAQIRDIFIHEAFLGFEVRYYLAIVVEGESEVVVVFPVSSDPFFYSCLILHFFSPGPLQTSYSHRKGDSRPISKVLPN